LFKMSGLTKYISAITNRPFFAFLTALDGEGGGIYDQP